MVSNQTIVSINGQVLDSSNAKISVFDRSFLFGDSIYEATLLKNNVPLFWQEHMQRLFQSAQLIHMPINIDPKEIERWIADLIKHFKSPMGLLRLVITRGEGAVNLYPPTNIKNNVVIYLVPLNYPKEWYEKGLKYHIATVERNPIKSLNPKAKTGNYLNSQLALMDGKSKGYDDALMINSSGHITEGTTNNFWFVKDKKIYTADSNQGILEGITRHKVFQLIQKNGFTLQEGAWTVEQALKADEAFMTSATKGIVPVVQLSQWKIAQGVPGPITKKLHSIYEQFVDQYVINNNWKSK